MNYYRSIAPLLLSIAWLPVLVLATDAPITGHADPALATFDQLMTSFMKEHSVPGAALAVARHGKIVYARGFGYADVAEKKPVEPDALFRIASVSKMFTGAAIVQLEERQKLKTTDAAFAMLNIRPYLEPGDNVDPRLAQVTISQLLHHTGGFDRAASFDPMFRSIVIARATGTKPPAGPHAIIQYMEGRPLDFDPGTKEAYSNFGYCVLGRIIEHVSGMTYGDYVSREILFPLGIHRMRLGRSLEPDHAEGEVHYYPRNNRQVKSVFSDDKVVPVAYGGWDIEAMDSHGGWIASAPELARFASSLDDVDHCPILHPATIHTMFQRPTDTGFDAAGKPKSAYYTCGWLVRPVGQKGAMNTWHNGQLDGTSTLVVRRYDGLTWAVLFNTDFNPKHQSLSSLIDPLLHAAADSVKTWPKGSDFQESNDHPAKRN